MLLESVHQMMIYMFSWVYRDSASLQAVTLSLGSGQLWFMVNGEWLLLVNG